MAAPEPNQFFPVEHPDCSLEMPNSLSSSSVASIKKFSLNVAHLELFYLKFD